MASLTIPRPCKVKYQGASYPEFHGARCSKDAPHADERHFAIVNGKALSWLTEEEKAALRG